MKIKRTITGGIGEGTDTINIEELEEGDQVRIGFTKGTLKKATFELYSHQIVSYEAIDKYDLTYYIILTLTDGSDSDIGLYLVAAQTVSQAMVFAIESFGREYGVDLVNEGITTKKLFESKNEAETNELFDNLKRLDFC